MDVSIVVIGIHNHLSHFLIVTSVMQDRRTIMEDVAPDEDDQGRFAREERQHMCIPLLSMPKITARCFSKHGMLERRNYSRYVKQHLFETLIAASNSDLLTEMQGEKSYGRT